MKNLKIGVRLGLAFGLTLLLLVVIAVVGVSRLSELNANTDKITARLYPMAEASQRLSYLVMDVARIKRNLILITDEKAMASNKDAMDKTRAAIGEQVAVLDGLVQTERGRELLAALKTSREAFVAFSNDVVALALQNKNAEATALLYGERYATQAAYLDVLQDMSDFQEKQMDDAASEAAATFATAKNTLLGVAGLALVLAIFGAWFIARSITRPLNQAVEAANRVADGDLSRAIVADARDETGLLLSSLGRMQDSLAQTVGSVRGNADSVATASAQIAQGNTDLSQRTEEQASALQQTAATMNELSSTVRNNADNARQAHELATGASAVAARGGAVVAEVVDTMKVINDSSKRIADIISVIDGIAFQTNILALNAAVEAARAGEQGRGFAVVAGEVRTLAQRSAEAAKEIKTLITDSVGQVDRGTALVDNAGRTMTEIVAAIKRVNDIVSEITAASAEQSTAVNEVGEAVTQMDQVTQQNAALVEESAAAAESLRQQAQQLVQAVSVFTLSDREAAAAPATAHAAVAAAPVAAAPVRVERRGPNRATNVTRPAFGRAAAAGATAKAPTSSSATSATPVAAGAARTGTDDWEAF